MFDLVLDTLLISPTHFENLEVYDANRNATIHITNTDNHRENVNNDVAKANFDEISQNIVRQRKQVVINKQPDNQTVFNRLSVVPCKSSFKDTTNRHKFRDRKILTFSDRILKESNGKTSIAGLEAVIQDILVFQGHHQKQSIEHSNNSRWYDGPFE